MLPIQNYLILNTLKKKMTSKSIKKDLAKSHTRFLDRMTSKYH